MTSLLHASVLYFALPKVQNLLKGQSLNVVRAWLQSTAPNQTTALNDAG
jgi:hypothetical protein